MQARRHSFTPIFILILSIAIICLSFTTTSPDPTTSAEIANDPLAGGTTKSILSAKYGAIPLHFEPNVSSAGDDARFIARAAGYQVLLHHTGAHIRAASDAGSIEMQIAGTRPHVSPEAENELEGKTNYLIGNDPANWRTNVPNYAKVRYRDIYDGVDAVFYGDQADLEYDFIVAPEASADQITTEFTGIETASVNDAGDLVLASNGVTFHQKKPFAYQDIDGYRREIVVSYRIEQVDSRVKVGFDVGSYDREQTLVIDPVLSFSTYLGGNSETTGTGIAVDPNGNAYVAGYTSSTAGFPLVGPFQNQNPGGNAAFVTKINASGTAFVYSTYLTAATGFGNSAASSIAVDPAGNAYVAGISQSCNFPTTPGSFMPVVPNCGGNFKGFVVKLNQSGSGLAYGTYLSSPDFLFSGELTGIALDPSNNAYITGWTQTQSFPTTSGAFKRTLAANTQNAFVSKLNSSGSALVFSTFVGINTPVPNTDPYDKANAIAVDSAGNAYITGQSVSQNFPVTNNAFQTFPGSRLDAFVTKLNSNGTALVYSTYLGGNGDEVGRAIAVDTGGNAYVTGYFDGTNGFPFTPNAFRNGAGENCCASVLNGFLTKVNPTGTALVYSTSLGTERQAMSGNGIAVDNTGSAYVVGSEGISAAYVVNAIQPVSQNNDSFILKMNPAGTALTYSTHFGGSNGSSIGNAIAIDPAGAAYITGSTNASNFPISAGAPQGTKPGGQSNSSFIAKIATLPSDCPAITINPQPLSNVVFGTVYDQQLTATGGTGPYTFSQAPGFGTNNLPAGLTLTADGRITGMPTNRNFGSYIVTIQAVAANGCVGIRTFNLVYSESASAFTIKIVGRDAILRGRENRYNFVYTNNSDVNALMVPLYIRIPDYFTWRTDFQVLDTIQPLAGPPLDYSHFPIHFVDGGQRVIALVLPTMRARSTGSVSIVITVPDLPQYQGVSFEIEAHLGKPLVYSVSPGAGGTANLQRYAEQGCRFLNTPGSPCETQVVNFARAQANEYVGGTGNNAGSFIRLLSGALWTSQHRPAGSLENIIFDAAIDTMLTDSSGVNSSGLTGSDFRSGSVVGSLDPNDKVGPIGVGAPRYIGSDVPIPYVIYFENLSTATAPAQEVVITDQLDVSKYDLNTFAFGDISIGSMRLSALPSRNVFNRDFDLRPANNIIARINATLDLQTGIITWRMKAIDPITGLPPEDPFAGILPPNTISPRGEGSVMFRVKARSDLVTGAEVRNQARIFFDTNLPIDTPVWLNTIDKSSPASSVQGIPASQPPSFTVNWAGTDGGSGVSRYSVYVSDNGGAFSQFLADTTATSGVFTGQVGHTYGFYSIATDAVGNREGPKLTAEATTTVNAAQPAISGRVFTPSGTAIRNARVTLTDSAGTARVAVTSSFGVYQFTNVVPGQTYILSVASKRYRFAPKILPITASLADVDFVGLE